MILQDHDGQFLHVYCEVILLSLDFWIGGPNFAISLVDLGESFQHAVRKLGLFFQDQSAREISDIGQCRGVLV
jgi:hypothetical protein